MSEQILNGTSAQIGYTVPFTLVHAGKYRTEDKLKMQNDNGTKHNPEKAGNEGSAWREQRRSTERKDSMRMTMGFYALHTP